ncbi:MAG TPA: glycosyltransferase [Burkholderiales bacterium]
MRAFLYVQHLLGVGHLKRTALVARALRAAGAEVTLVSGGAPVRDIPVDVQLPPASAGDASFRTLLDAEGRPVGAEWKRRRAGLLLDAWRRFHDAGPAGALLIELFPFGRRQMRFELMPLLEDTRRVARRPLLVCSVRDLLQPRPGREAEALALFERFFDRLLVHGDPRLAGLERTFGAAPRLADRLHYTGYVVEDPPAASGVGAGEVLVSAGGGAVGARLLATALEARPRTLLREATWRLLAGLNAGEAELRRLAERAGPGVVVERHRSDVPALLANCALSISQAGYNTVAEVLQARVRSVLVPFAGDGEVEQTLRAQALAAHGAAQVLEEARLDADSLADAVNRAVRGPRPPAELVELDGARRSAALLAGWLAGRAA